MSKLDEASTASLKRSPSGHNGSLSSIPGDTINNNARQRPSYRVQAQEEDNIHNDISTVMAMYEAGTALACTACHALLQQEQVGRARGAGREREDVRSMLRD